MQVVKFIGCLKKLKSSLSCTQRRKRKERKRNVGFAYCYVKKIWNLREERPCGMRLRNCGWCQWVERSGEWEHLFFWVRYAFTSRNTVFYPVWPKWSGMGRYLNQNETTMFLYWQRYRNGKYQLYWPIWYGINSLCREKDIKLN